MNRVVVRGALLYLTACVIAVLPALAQEASDTWLALLKSPKDGTRAKAARELGKSGDPNIIPALTEALKDPSEKVRREVVVALSKLATVEVLDPLITALEDPAADIRALAVEGLVGFYTGQIPSIGFTGFWKRRWQEARNRFQEENLRIDPGLRVEPRVINALIGTLSNQTAIEASRKAATGLGVLVARPAVPHLVQAAYSTDKELALEALGALAKIQDRSAGPQLINVLDSTDDDIKREAAVTVGILRTTDALPKLQSMYENNPEKKTRKKALEGLAYLGSPVSVPLFMKAMWSDDKDVRTHACEGLGRARDASSLSDLEKAVHLEKDAEPRLAMQFAITALGKEDFFSALVTALSSRFHGDSAQSYIVDLAQDPKFLPRLYPYLNSQDADVRRRLCTVLMYAGDSSSLEHLERVSHDSRGEVASEALRALRAVRARAQTPVSAPAAAIR